jgi:hypothetical protein
VQEAPTKTKSVPTAIAIPLIKALPPKSSGLISLSVLVIYNT